MTINDLSLVGSNSISNELWKWLSLLPPLRRILCNDDDGPRSALTSRVWGEQTGVRGLGVILQISDQPGAQPPVRRVHNLQAGLRAGKNSSGGYVFMWAKNALNPTFCVCIFLYLFIIIANVYFNVQISAKYYAERLKFLPNFLQILSWRNN